MRVSGLSGARPSSFKLDSRPSDLDGLVELLDGNLSEVEFGGYPFDDYDPSRHDLSTAHVPVATLRRIGAYDDSAYLEYVQSGAALNSDMPSSKGELSRSEAHASLLLPGGVDIGDACYYVSDLHLDHKLSRAFPDGASELEIREYLERLAEDLASGIVDRNDRTLIVLGDTSHVLEVTRLFFSCLRRCWGGQIVATLGNHELWDYGKNKGRALPTVDDVARLYRELFADLGVILLQNDILVRVRGLRDYLLKQDYLEKTSDEDLGDILSHSSRIIIGGIGFTGVDNNYNATSGLYRDVVASHDEDMRQSMMMSSLHERIRRLAPSANVIVATHIPMRSWSEEPMQPGWIYVSGHTHRNTFTERDGIRAYEDNQVGYSGTRARLMRFFIESRYNPFRELADGIHEVTRIDYRDFNRERGIPIGSFTREGKILMLKREGVYLFLFIWDATGGLYLLSGGRITKLDIQEPNYYYENMVTYSSLVKDAFSGYQHAIRQVGDEVKRIGGLGTLHGCIVDIDFFNHVYLDPFTGMLTFYYAESVDNRVEFHDIHTHLALYRPELLKGLESLSEEGLQTFSGEPLILRGGETAIGDSIIATDTLMYRPSRVMLSIQYLFDANVIRNWNEEALDIKRSRDVNLPSPKPPLHGSNQTTSYLPEKTGHRGRPSMKVPISKWRKDHPSERVAECAANLGLSLQTVRKWWSAAE